MRLLVMNSIDIGGGVTTSFLSALEMIRNEGHEAIALVPDNFQFKSEVNALAAKTVYVKGLEKGGHVSLPFQIMQIVGAANKHDVDRIIVNNGRHVNLLKAAQKRPVICIYHGGKIDRIFKADKILTINDQQCEWIKERGFPEPDVTVVDNVMPMDELPAWQERSFETPLTIGTLRLLEPAKGVDTLVEAFGLLAADGKNFRGLIGSDGSQRQMLENRINQLGLSKNVSFTGWVDESAAFYKRLDLYVLPSRFEEWGLGIVEAQANSLPVVATDCLGPKRLIQDGSNGLLVERENPRAMADAIIRLMETPELISKMTRTGYDSADQYLMKNIQNDYVSFLTGAISKLEK